MHAVLLRFGADLSTTRQTRAWMQRVTNKYVFACGARKPAMARAAMAARRRPPGPGPRTGAKLHQNAACNDTITLRGSPYQLPVPVPMVR